MIVALTLGLAWAQAELEEVYGWKQMEFAWPDEKTKQDALQSGAYIPENNLPLGIQKWKNKLFVTVPRWKAGVAASLNVLDTDKPNKTAALVPYPDWTANTLPPAGAEKVPDNTVVSVFRTRVDVCDRLWVMDTGLADILGEPRQITKPALVIFDLNTDKLIRRYEFKATDLKEDSFFANVVVDVTPDRCDKAYAYVPDLGGYGVVVYSLAENDSWRVTHNFFHFDPLKGDLTVGGVNFQWTDGVFGLALSEPKANGQRLMYFHALASTKEFSVPTGVLQNKTLATDPHNYYMFKLEGDRGHNTQATSSAYDERTKILFLTQLNKDGAACWNTQRGLSPSSLGTIAKDPERLIFTNDIMLADDYVYMLSDKMSLFLYKSLQPDEVNYRIMRIKVQDAIRGTPCAGY